eukprot:7354364-Pyramimonas_sp.AAC.1
MKPFIGPAVNFWHRRMQRPGARFSYDAGRDILVHQRLLSQIKKVQLFEISLVRPVKHTTWNATFKDQKDMLEQ